MANNTIPDFHEVLEAFKREEHYYSFDKKDSKLAQMAVANFTTIADSLKRDNTFDLNLYQKALKILNDLEGKAIIDVK